VCVFGTPDDDHSKSQIRLSSTWPLFSACASVWLGKGACWLMMNIKTGELYVSDGTGF
jgi:hypothetical protein